LKLSHTCVRKLKEMSLYIGIYTFRGWWLKHGFTFERIRPTEFVTTWPKLNRDHF
jgi:hypothetical protein